MKRYAMLLVLCCAALVLSAAALWQNPVPILKGDNLEWNRCGAVTSDGCMIYVWSGTLRGDRDIFAQKVSSAGNIIWQQPLVVDGKPSRQTAPVITRSSDNNFIIAWLDYQDYENKIIRAQKITSGGQLLWLAGGVSVGVYDDYIENLDIAADHNGGAYLTWTDMRFAGADIYAQHLDTYGNALWAVEGLPVANSTANEKYPNLLVDENGALVVAYQLINYPAYPLYVQWINYNGEFLWTQPLWIADCFMSITKRPQLAGLIYNTVIVTWGGQATADSDLNIFAQRFDSSGYTYLGTNYAVYSDSGLPNPTVQINPRIVKVSNIEVVIAWEDYRYNYQEADIFAQKIFADGVQSWIPQAVPVCMETGHQDNPRMISDGSGGAVITWDDFRTGNYNNPDVYAQHISFEGYQLWNLNGIAICTAPGEQHDPMVRKINDKYLIGWMDSRSGSPAMYYQVVNELGAPLLQPDGKLIHQGLYSFGNPSEKYETYSRSADTAILWVDQRHAQFGHKVYFQFLNPDGTVDLEPNGRPLTLSSEGFIDSFSAVVTPENQIAVAWTENNRLKAQLIDASGNRLWGDNGMFVTETEPLRQNYAQISYEDGAFYIGWSELIMPAGSSIYLYRVYGQKLVNGQKQWGPDGIQVSVINESSYYTETILDRMAGRYFIWTHDVYVPDSYRQIRVKLLNPDGSTAQGWIPDGLAASDYLAYDTLQYRPQSLLTAAGLFVAWRDYRIDFMSGIYGQMLSPQGVRLWDPSGVDLTDNAYENSDFSLLLSDNVINLVWVKHEGNNYQSIFLRRIALSGEVLPDGTDLLISLDQNNQYNSLPRTVKFPNGAMLAAWDHSTVNTLPEGGSGPDINFRYLSPGGIPQGNIGTFWTQSVYDRQYTARLSVVDNEAYLFWMDSDFSHGPGRCDPEFIENFDIYAQKLSNEVVSNQDEISVWEQAVLRQNYPNPFTGSTGISFSLPAKGEARIDIYNVKGQKVNTILNSLQEKGSGSAVWNGLDSSGNACASGVYYCKLTANGQAQTRKMLLLK